MGCLKTKEPIATFRHVPRHSPSYLRVKTQIHPPVGRHQRLPPGSLHKPLDHPHPPGADTRSKHQEQENYDLQHSPDPTLGPAEPTSRPTQPPGHRRPHTQLCQELPLPPHEQSDMSCGIPGPCSQTPGTSSAASSLALTLGPGFTYQWVGNSLRVFGTLTLPTSEPALAQGPLRFHNQPPRDQALINSSQQHPHKAEPGNQPG